MAEIKKYRVYLKYGQVINVSASEDPTGGLAVSGVGDTSLIFKKDEKTVAVFDCNHVVAWIKE